MPVRTITLQKGNYNTTVSVTGKVESQDVSTVSSTVTGAKVASVNVEVGDTVKQGDIIAVLDSELIDNQIELEKENIANQIEAAQEAYDNAVLVKDRNWGTFDQARQAMETACDESAIQALENAANSANDQTYHGKVTSISATSSESAQQNTASLGSTMTSEVSFPVTVTLDEGSDLLIGMNAKVQIVLESKENVYSVPIDATTTNENGQTFIYIQNEAQEFEPLVVTTTASNDYSVIIESD